ncbi:LTA synthase family protein [Marinobacter sp.]|uniref:LTA synthase family protein n=1 Tax=Marinobacter sp. TaxID=50741 RepID=UPI003562DCC0
MAIRFGLVLQSGVWPTPWVVVPSDLAGALVLSVLLNLTHGPARAILIVTLGCALYVAGMHLTTHGTLFQLAFAGKGMDSTFITGSLLNKYLLLLPLYTGMAWLLHWLHRALVPEPPAPGSMAAIAVSLTLLAYTAGFNSLTTPANNVVASTLAQIPGAIVTPLGTSLTDEVIEEDEIISQQVNFFHQKITSRPVESPPNVLLILIEGLSGGYFPDIRQHHDLDPAVSLDDLEATLKARGFRLYRNTVSMERQTDRGTFTIICGQYPDFRRESRKLLDVASNGKTAGCLPGKLRDHGYHTAYWQAAPIQYMGKDKFMPNAGFMEVTGAEAFDKRQDFSGWGPADPVFFPQITVRLRNLHRLHTPWFVTLLNVGTHHPFDTGEKPLPAQNNEITLDPQKARRKAMETMAESLTRFLDELDADGVLDNTLIILTSDESGGFVREDHENLPLNNNLGALAIRPPENDSLERYADQDALVAQLDIPLTILDAAGLGSQAGQMVGRSLQARTDPDRRGLLLADTYTGLKYFLNESGSLLSCTELMTRCTSWSFEPKRLFGSLKEQNDDPFLTLQERLALFESATRQLPSE